MFRLFAFLIAGTIKLVFLVFLGLFLLTNSGELFRRAGQFTTSSVTSQLKEIPWRKELAANACSLLILALEDEELAISCSLTTYRKTS